MRKRVRYPDGPHVKRTRVVVGDGCRRRRRRRRRRLVRPARPRRLPSSSFSAFPCAECSAASRVVVSALIKLVVVVVVVVVQSASFGRHQIVVQVLFPRAAAVFARHKASSRKVVVVVLVERAVGFFLRPSTFRFALPSA